MYVPAMPQMISVGATGSCVGDHRLIGIPGPGNVSTSPAQEQQIVVRRLPRSINSAPRATLAYAADRGPLWQVHSKLATRAMPGFANPSMTGSTAASCELRNEFDTAISEPLLLISRLNMNTSAPARLRVADKPRPQPQTQQRRETGEACGPIFARGYQATTIREIVRRGSECRRYQLSLRR